MLTLIDKFLNKITMYRLVLYYLIALLLVAEVLSYLNILPFSPFSLGFSVLFITLLCWLVNTASAWLFSVPVNVESVYITALILALIISPMKTTDMAYLWFMAWVAIWSMVSKYLFAISRKHIFNPAAFAVALTALTIGQAATWWVGTAWMLPVVIIGGLLVVRKTRRWNMVFVFIGTAVATILAYDLVAGRAFFSSLQKILIESPLFFFAFVMLTEPLTTPPTNTLQTIYGGLVGFLFAPQVHIGGIFSTPELALLSGNIFSYLVSPKKKLLLTFKHKLRLSPTIYNFIFEADTKVKFRPGQYMEWTLDHELPDNRGNRRYFTVASSPTEADVLVGVKFYRPASSYKHALLELHPGQKILAGQLAGDFVLPKIKNEKYIFIAGGIGITPFRSMIKYLLDTGQQRDIVLFYSNSVVTEAVYTEIFDQAVEQLNLKAVYTLTDQSQVPQQWQGRVGPISAEMIYEEAPDFAQRIFYISGPRSMVAAFEKALAQMGIHKSRIKTDFFPGFV